MARTIDEIKQEMTADFIKQPAVISAYGLDGKKSFKDCFSVASIESILFYVFAVGVWSLEKLFDLHKNEVEEMIEQLEPHTLRWYVNKTKAYMHGKKLVKDTDQYDTSGMTDTEIEAAKVVKYAVATESNTVVYIKVARQNEKGNPEELTTAQLQGLTSYVNEIKDAGVSVQLRNEPADNMKISLLIYYDPTLLTLNEDKSIGTLEDGSEPVREAVQEVITSLPFNGVFRKSDLMAALQALDCVEVVDIRSVSVKASNATVWTEVEGFNRPYSGYYSIDELNVRYIPYESVE